jgi:endoglucanase Acf2
MISQEIIYFLRCTAEKDLKILKILANYTWVCRTTLALELDETQLSATLSDLEEKGLVVTATFPTFYDTELAVVALAGCHCELP